MRSTVRVPASIQTLGWGVFCASSWTWCIGMFLPIIMLREYGLAGFLVFAVPNVVGCAAFGYIVAKRDRSEALQQRHGRAMRAFSIITLAYHIFFLSFIALLLFGTETRSVTIALALPLVMYALAFLLSDMRGSAWPIAALIAYAVSIALFVTIGIDPLRDLPIGGEQTTHLLIWLAPAVVFGFLLCPYLDLTFHRTLRSSPSRHAFSIFGITFAVMIVLTLAYRELVYETVLPLLVAHLLVQSLFTMAAHVRELRDPQVQDVQSERNTATPLPGLLVPILALPIALLGFFVREPLVMGEDNYLRFLAFYGLVFPAYVLLFMNPWRPLPVSGRALAAAIAVVLLSLPLYELGFIHNQTWLLLAPVLVLCILPFIFGRAQCTTETQRAQREFS